MFIEVHHHKSGEAFLINADAIETLTDGKVYVRGDEQPYMVRETLEDFRLLLDPRRMSDVAAPATKPGLPSVRLPRARAG